MKEEIENLVKYNYRLSELLNTPKFFNNRELISLLVKEPIFNQKIKESLDYYKPRDPTKEISDSTQFRKAPIQRCIKDILLEFSNQYVK